MFKIIDELKFKYNLYYYKLFYPNEMNIYNIINDANKWKKLATNYFTKYPNSSAWINLNDELFKDNPCAKNEYIKTSIEQKILKKKIISNVNCLCGLEEYRDYNMCSKKFKDYYIEKDYHITDDIDGFVENIKSDIIKNNLDHST